MTLKNNRAHFLCHFKLCVSFHNHLRIQTGVTVRKRPIRVKIVVFSPVTLKFDRWPWKTTWHIFYTTSGFVPHFIAIGEFKLELQSGNAQFGSKSSIFCPMLPWHFTDDIEKDRAPLLCYFKLCTSFRSHLWIQTGVMVRKIQIGAKFALTRVTMTLELWLWAFAWTPPLSMVITPENFMMIWWQGHSEKGVTDGQTDGRKGPFIELLVLQLKISC